MERGHRLRAHTADVILEAFGPDLATCCEESVAALVGLFADVDAAEVVDEHVVAITPGPPERMLLDLLEEVVFVLDTADAVPVSANVRTRADGGLTAALALATRRSVAPTGAVPKGVSRSGLTVDRAEGRVRCSALVDV